MTLADLFTKLKTLKLPVAYAAFNKPTALPFIVYFESGSADVLADNVNFVGVSDVVVEFYSKVKDTTNEAAIEKLFSDNEIIYSKGESLLKDEACHLTIYKIQII